MAKDLKILLSNIERICDYIEDVQCYMDFTQKSHSKLPLKEVSDSFDVAVNSLIVLVEHLDEYTTENISDSELEEGMPFLKDQINRAVHDVIYDAMGRSVAFSLDITIKPDETFH